MNIFINNPSLAVVSYSTILIMTDVLVLILVLLIAWGAYTLVGKEANEKSKGLLSLTYIFCIMTAMEYYHGSVVGCIIILCIAAGILGYRFLLKGGNKLPWSISLLAEWALPIVLYHTLDKFSGLSSGFCLIITLISILIGFGIFVFIIFKQEK